MKRRIDLGHVDVTHAAFNADLDIVLRSNLLVQANSGGGKSWLLRRMIEQSFGRVPQIVIDPEGEFATLRSHFDLVLVGKGGDTPADIRSAQLLAHRLLELGASAVVDLFEMSKSQRPLWVAAFVQALVDAPKKLWRDLLLYVDEAHELAPEAGHGVHESAAEKTCRHALIDFAAKGRKRGYGIVAATQRLGKLSKDFAAELKNVLIGQTFIDIDRERAAGSLGISKTDKPEFFRNVKTLHPGSFFALGRALALESTLVRIGSVLTEHPEAGRRQSAPPPPTEKIRHLLPQLADLPKEAETKIQTEKELRARIVELEREVRLVEGRLTEAAAVADRPHVTVERSVLKPEHIIRVEKLIERLEKARDFAVEAFKAQIDRVVEVESAVSVALGNLALQVNQAKSTPAPSKGVTFTGGTTVTMTAKPLRPAFVDPGRGPRQAVVRDDNSLSRCARALLGVLAVRGYASDSQLAALSGYRVTSGGFANSLSELRTRGLIDNGSPDRRAITDAGRAAAGPVDPLPVGRELLDYWMRKLGKAEATLLSVIYDSGTIDRDTLAERTGYSRTSGGFANSISALRTLELVSGPNGGDLTIADVFKE